METLTIDDLIFIKESLAYTKHNFENYTGYPSYEYKQQRLNEVAAVAAKVDELIKSRRENK